MPKTNIRKPQKKYIENVAVALANDPKHSIWTVIGHGRALQSETDKGEHNIEVIVAPYYPKEKNVVLAEAQIKVLPVGGLELYKRRTSWKKNLIHRTHLRKTSNAHFEIHAQQYKNITLKDALAASKLDVFNQEYSPNSAITALLSSKYLHYPLENHPAFSDLYIPCTELIRFYYGSSSGLIKAAFSAGDPEQVLFNPDKTKHIQEISKHTVQVRKGICDVDSPFVARVAFCEFARKKFEQIYSHSFIDQQKPDLYPICAPPIDEIITWDIHGIAKGNSFFATSLNACSGSFPFQGLLYGRDNDARGSRNQEPEKKISIPKKETKFSSDDEAEGENDNSNLPELADTLSPTLDVEEIILEDFYNPPNFIGLNGIMVDKVIKLHILDESKQAFVIYDGDEIIDYLATASGSGSSGNKNIAKLSITRHQPQENDNEEYIYISDVMASLDQSLKAQELGEVEVAWLFKGIHHKFPHATFIPYRKTMKNHNLCFTCKDYRDKFIKSKPKNKTLYRPVAYFKIWYNEQVFYLIEILGNDGRSPGGVSTLFFSEYKLKSNDSLVYKQLKKFNDNRNDWAKDVSKPSFFARRKRHSNKGTAEQKAEAISKLILEAQRNDQKKN